MAMQFAKRATDATIEGDSAQDAIRRDFYLSVHAPETLK
jgi:hypothetical protein